MGNVCQYVPTIALQDTQNDFNLKNTLKKENLKSYETKIVLPKINSKVKALLQLKRPLEDQLSQISHQCVSKRLGSKDIYFGQVNLDGVPNGIGKIFKQNGDVIVSEFVNGIANGRSFYIYTNQVYCQGITVNGLLNCDKGIIQSPIYKYSGGFKDNKFDNKGIQITQTTKFQGLFINGKKKKGKLFWIYNGQTYSYEGGFNQDQQFSEKGILIQPFGKYEGSFLNGQKHGFGVYTYNSQLRYEGQYRYGKKWGQGKLINIGNTLCYQGQFQNGLPNGLGKGFKDNKVIHEGMFVQGIIKLPYD